MKRLLCTILVISLILGYRGYVSLGKEISVETKMESGYETHYVLITGNVHMWANSSGDWIRDNNGLYPSPGMYYKNPNEVRVQLPQGALLNDIYAYDMSNFIFEQDELHYHWNVGAYSGNKSNYDKWYFRRQSNRIEVDQQHMDGEEAVFKWSAELTPQFSYYDVKDSIVNNDRDTYFNFFGGEDYCKENLPYLVDQYDDMVDQVFSPKVQGLLIFIPIVIEYQLPVNTPVVHVSHYEEDGTPLSSYDYTDYIGIDETKTYDATEIYGYIKDGSKVSYNTVPTGDIDVGTLSVDVTADATITDIYIEFYYIEDEEPESGLEPPTMSAVIYADERDSEVFDAVDGIPTTEELYVNVHTDRYIEDSAYAEVEGTNTYDVTVTKNYHLTWEENEPIRKTKHHHHTREDGSTYTTTSHYYVDNWVGKSDNVSVSKTYAIDRDYSFWLIEYLEVYGVDWALVENTALPGGTCALNPKVDEYSLPTVDQWHDSAKSEHLQDPTNTSLDLGTQTISGGRGGKPSVPTEDFSGKAEAHLDEIQVRNDYLSFDGDVLMDKSWHDTDTPDPVNIPESQPISRDALYQKDLVIDYAIENKQYNSQGTLQYKGIENGFVERTDANPQYSITNINKVTIHTPVVDYADSSDNRTFNQLHAEYVAAKLNNVADPLEKALILKKTFTVTYPNSGQHRDIQGYGDRDYSKYIQEKWIQFPFDVYLGSDRNGTFIPEGEWYLLFERIDPWDATETIPESFTFYLPSWVEEGDYEYGNGNGILLQTTAINTPYEESDYDECDQMDYNQDLSNYIANDTLDVEVVGRLQGLKLFDISDDMWTDAFWSERCVHNGTLYFVGNKGPDGQVMRATPSEQRYTLPIVQGSHPSASNLAIKPGYELKFVLDTIGSMNGKLDQIRVLPTFQYYSLDGINQMEVDLYYNKGESTYIRMGSDEDEHSIEMQLGNPWHPIPTTSLDEAGRYLYYRDLPAGYTEATAIQKFKRFVTPQGGYTALYVPESSRYYVGDTSNLPIEKAGDADFIEKVRKSRQRWLFKYYLPNEVFAAPQGTDIPSLVETQGYLNAYDSVWLKEGYIVVNFEIETIVDNDRDHPRLSYWNVASNYDNQWQMEGYNATKDNYNDLTRGTDSFSFEDGDIGLFYTDKKASDDLGIYGTH